MLLHFHSFRFLVFFGVVFTIYWALPRHRARMVWLLIASCVFYMSWNPWLISLILFSAGLDYLAALALERVASDRLRRLMLILSITANLALLAFFKYANFFLDSTFATLSLLGFEPHRPLLQLLLPLGISFYTFETISYVVDVYRGRIAAVRSPLDYALYIMFFPHLIAGPIVRPRDFLPQLRQHKHFSWDRFQVGLQFFLAGLFKKAILADHLAAVIDPVFAEPAAYAPGAVWLAVLGYAAQIYCDFSGYSDMAVGLAHTLGFKLPRNFNLPYLASNIAEFWQRWHISLSTWLRDYLYIPLGGSRNGGWATYRNLMITMLLGGLWHGANWTFVVWGLYHGLLLVVHRALRLPRFLSASLMRPVAVTLTFASVCLGWVFFRAQTFGDAWMIVQRLAGLGHGLALSTEGSLIVSACLLAVGLSHLFAGMVDLKRFERWLPAPVLGTGLTGMCLLALFLFPEDGKAFIYFQF